MIVVQPIWKLEREKGEGKMLTYLILTAIIGYSSWTLYRSFRKWRIGKSCDSCSGCVVSGNCPVQQLKAKEVPLILNQRKI